MYKRVFYCRLPGEREKLMKQFNLDSEHGKNYCCSVYSIVYVFANEQHKKGPNGRRCRH